jgi:NodT family efflux transporter outer membrane factor (OMF) lipoprotein
MIAPIPTPARVKRPASRLRSPKTAVAGILALMASGCSAVGPNFAPPAIPAATRYISVDEASTSDPVTASIQQRIALGEEVRGDWWSLFRSTNLDLLVKQAITGSLTLQSAQARLAEARESVAAAAAALYPQASLAASLDYEKESVATFGLKPDNVHLPPNFNVFQVGPTVSYSPDLFGGVHRQIEQQSALADLQRDQLYAAYLSLTGNTVTQAITLAITREQLKALQDVLDIDEQNVTLVQREAQDGTVSQSDVIQAQSQLAADKTLKPALDQQLSTAKHALAVLVGRASGDWTPPDLEISSLTLPGRLPVSLPSELAHQRPDILGAEAQLHAASARIGIATAQLYPSITLSAGITPVSLNGSNLFNPASMAWSAAAGLTQPIFDGGMRRAQRRAALDDFKASAADYQQTVLQAFAQVADVLQALNHDADLLVAERRAAELAAESERLQRIAYVRGGAGVINLLDAQRQYQQARAGYLRAEGQRYQDTVQLLVAMGGGWWGADLDKGPASSAKIGGNSK